MRRKTFGTGLMLAGAGLAIICGWTTASAMQDARDRPAPAGSWARKDAELTIEFVDKQTLKICPHGEKAAFVVVCEYTVDKAGTVKARLSELQAKEEIKQKAKEHLPAGLQFSFRWQATDNAATIGDVKGDNIDLLRQHLEGDYQKK